MPRSWAGSSASPRRRGRRLPSPGGDESAGVAARPQEPGGKLRIDHRVLRRTSVELAMTFRGMALRRLNGLARAVTNDLAASRAAQHRSRGALARVLAMGEPQLGTTRRAAAARFAFGGRVAGHPLKRTGSGGR